MKSDRSGILVNRFWRHFVFLIMVTCSPLTFSQSISLTPQQEAMLNQLPPEQRQEAMRTIEQLRQQRNDSVPLSSLTEELSTNGQDEDSFLLDEDSDLGPVRAESGSSLIVTLIPKIELSRESSEILLTDIALQRVQGSHVYVLDANGVLKLPGLSGIPVLGLESDQIQARVAAEPALNVFDVAVSILEISATGTDALEPYGYELFESTEYGFDPVISGPVPGDYVLGPGDSVRVQLFGNANEIHEIEVSRDGVLNLPQLGPITVAGLRFSEFRDDIGRRVQEMLIGTQVSVTMGRLRTIRVFVLGDANRPGSYVVDSLSTISSVLYRSGGVSRVGTLRNIQLKRSGTVVARLDLYDLLLNGDTSGDERLQSGDVVFIPPIGPQVSVGGAVKRPAIYETRGNTAVADVIRFAGGLTPNADPGSAVIERIQSGQKRTLVSIDAGGNDALSTSANAGDVLTIPEILPVLEDSVSLQGHVHRPGPRQWRAGMRLSDLIGSLAALMPRADTNYVLVRRENAADRHVDVVSANLSLAIANPQSSANIALRPRDTVHVFDLEFGRQRVVEPILEELKLQARFGEPYQEVSISGQVQAPGVYPLEPGMRISDLIRAGGSLSEDAYTVKAELVRYAVVGDDYRDTEIVDIDLESIIRGDTTADIVLQEHDNLRISGLPDWDSLWTATLEGEVTFPGSYRIKRGEKLSDLLERAGGLTNSSFPEGAIFLRESLREREQEQLAVLAQRLESDLISLSLESGDSVSLDAQSTGQSLLNQLRETEAVGRLVIDLKTLAANPGAATEIADLELRDGDRLLVPKLAQEVTVLGETQQNTSHLYQPGLSRADYISLSGGLTRRADKKLIYVVRASGAVVSGGRSKWFSRKNSTEIRPGDTIVVPLETDRIPPLTLWSSVTQILYQAAIAVAAVQTFNN